MRAKLLQSCLTLCNPMDYSPPVSSIHGILQTRILKQVAISFSRGSSQPRDGPHLSYVSCIGRWVLYHQYHLGSPENDMSGYNFFFFLSFISLVLNSGGRIVLLSKRFPILHLFIPPPPLKLLAATEFVRCYGFFLLFSLSPQFYFFLNYLQLESFSMQPFQLNFLPLEIGI